MSLSPFDGPIPGQSLTAEPGNAPWERPSKFSDPMDALEMYMERLGNEEVVDDVMDMFDIGIPIDIPDGSIQTISYMTDLEKINKAKYLIPNYDGIEKYDNGRYERAGSSYPQGFKQNTTKYVVTFWTRGDT